MSKPAPIKFSPEQAALVSAVLDGRNVLATGPAGTGKSTVLNFLRDKFGRRLAVTASTGIAALNVGGTTLHSFAGLGKGDAPAAEIADQVLARKGKAFRNIRHCRILAVDEISMVSGELLETLDEVFRLVRDRDEPFGGVQMVGFGDFLQLPPVSRADRPATFAFESPAWDEAGFETHLLTKVYRQADQAFADALGRLRVGDIHHPSIAMIGRRNNLPIPEDGIRPVFIHTHNADVERINLQHLAEIKEEEFTFTAMDQGQPQARERLDRDCLAPRQLRLRKGAQVMLLANLDLEMGLVNGSIGAVEKLGKDEIVVRFGAQLIGLERNTWEIQNNGEVLASRSQYPLRLAWAITSHKVQGMTLDRIECHLSKTFEYGQAYVAVSRCRTLDGLFLRDSTRHAFRAHPKALQFYKQAERAMRGVPIDRGGQGLLAI